MQPSFEQGYEKLMPPEMPQALAQSTSSDCMVTPRVRILCGLDEEELRAFFYVDILPVVDWDNTR